MNVRNESPMPFVCNVDVFGTQVGAAGGAPSIPRGRPFHVVGWVVDPQAGTVPHRVYGVLDGSAQFVASSAARSDVAAHFGNPALSESGFDLAFSTSDLVTGNHTLAIHVEDGLGRRTAVLQRTFSIVEGAATRAFPRAIVSGAMKSGSTYAWLVLTKYFGTEEIGSAELFRGGEASLDDWALAQLRGRSFVAHMHMRPYRSNLKAMEVDGITPIVMWRNLGDTVVSVDDHLRKQSVSEEYDGPKYLAMEAQARFGFVIRYMLPWYLSFFTWWRRENVPIFRYEAMVADQLAFFRAIVERLAGVVDEERLRSAIAASSSESNQRQNKNVGTVGRGAALLSDGNKALLEEMLRGYYEPLDDLIAELPWHASGARGV